MKGKQIISRTTSHCQFFLSLPNDFFFHCLTRQLFKLILKDMYTVILKNHFLPFAMGCLSKGSEKALGLIS